MSRRCHLGGNSLGGGIAWRYALAHPDPELVRSLMLVDAAAYPGPPKRVPLAFRLVRVAAAFLNQLPPP